MSSLVNATAHDATIRQQVSCALSFPFCLGEYVGSRAVRGAGDAVGAAQETVRDAVTGATGSVATSGGQISDSIDSIEGAVRWSSAAVMALAFAFVVYVIWRLAKGFQ